MKCFVHEDTEAIAICSACSCGVCRACVASELNAPVFCRQCQLQRSNRRGRFSLWPRGKPESQTCSFCGKSTAEVANLIVGPGVSICDECVDLCVDVITKKKG